jgi:hypothetical protein
MAGEKALDIVYVRKRTERVNCYKRLMIVT